MKEKLTSYLRKIARLVATSSQDNTPIPNTSGSSRQEPPPDSQERPTCIVDEQLARDSPNASLLKAFFDADGVATNATPVELQNLSDAERAHLHFAAGELNLYHETARTARGPILVISSRKNSCGPRRMDKLTGIREDFPNAAPGIAEYH